MEERRSEMDEVNVVMGGGKRDARISLINNRQAARNELTIHTLFCSYKMKDRSPHDMIRSRFESQIFRITRVHTYLSHVKQKEVIIESGPKLVFKLRRPLGT